jgi:hypothetical protein
MKREPLNRNNLVVDFAYWLHPDDVPFRSSPYRGSPRIMHKGKQVNIWGRSVPVQFPVALVEEQAKADAAFFSQLKGAKRQSEIEWFTRHMASLGGRIVRKNIVVDYQLGELNSGSVQVLITNTGKRKHYNMFTNLFMVWQIKRRSPDNGLVLVLALKDRNGWDIATL